MPLILTCYASPFGLSAYISQPYADGDKPVAFASRSLTAAQKNYSKIDKEAAAIVFGVTRFYDYLFGRKFILKTDNSPIFRILGPEKGIPRMAAIRLQNWAYFLSAFDYEIECIRTEQNVVADALSRLPNSVNNNIGESQENTYLHYVVKSNIICCDYKAVARETAKDKILSLVKRMVEGGWPERKTKDWPEELKSYAQCRDELCIERGCLMWGQRVIVLPKMQAEVIEKFHGCHFGIIKMKSLAWSVV